MTHDAILRTARRAYNDLGLCVLPPVEDGSKKPQSEYKTLEELTAIFGKDRAVQMCTKNGKLEAGTWTWKHFQIERPSRDHMRDWYKPARGKPRSGIGLLTGAISKHLKLFEFDRSSTYETFLDAAGHEGLAGLVERIRSGYEEQTPSGGIHWLVYCVTPGGNTELAKSVNEDGEISVIIETREEGGFAIIAPTNGRVHPTGGEYRLLQGSLETITTVTPEEWQQLCDLAQTFDELPKCEESGLSFTATSNADDRPGDIFNERATWSEILEPHGWRLVQTQGKTEYWLRPGQTDSRWSATINAPGVKPDRFWCYTTSSVFQSRTMYTKFAVYAILNHGGDYSAAAKDLRNQGYRAKGRTAGKKGRGKLPAEAGVDDFRAYLPEHRYIYVPTRDLWPASSVDAVVGIIGGGDDAEKASTWLDRNQAVAQMTWAPGWDMLIEGRLISHGGWIEHPGVTTFNLYLPPTIEHGDPDKAGPWLEHVHTVYPTAAEHILDWLAHRVQRPQEKVNHALVFGGQQGIGKDTILEPVKRAVGPWNFQEVSPAHLLGRFNGFIKSVVMRVSEARDLGDIDRYKFYEHLKLYTAAPPDVLRCDEKNVREYSVLNVCGVIITSNHKTDGIYLPADDRRHYVAWSELTIDDFERDYFTELYRWYDAEGYGHVAAYLATRDLSDFDPKAPPPKTTAFWDIVDANRAPEDAELVDALDQLDWPDAVTLNQIKNAADPEFAAWLRDRANSRQIPHRMEAAGYVPVRNDSQRDGRWKVRGKNVVIYARRDLAVRERISAARKVAAE